MKNSNKAGILVIGIFIGVIAGIAIAAWMDYMGYEINPLYRISKIIYPDQTITNSEHLYSFNKDSADFSGDDNNNNEYDRSPGNEHDTAGSGNGDNDASQNGNSDSVEFGNDAAENFNPKESIKVASDQLIGSRAIKVAGLVVEKTNNLDSILVDDKYTSRNTGSIKVELWYSPINYTGYKWSNNKLVIFGFYELDMVKLKFLEKRYYFNYGTLYYSLEPTTTFRTLELMQDAALIKKLNTI